MNPLEILVDQLAAGSSPRIIQHPEGERRLGEGGWAQTASPTPESREDPETRRKDARSAAEEVAAAFRERAAAADVELHFNVIEATDTIQVEVREAESGRVIRKIPEDAILRLAAQLRAGDGAMVDDLI